MDRSKVAGVRSLEIMLSYTLTNLTVLIIQSAIVLGILNGAFQVPCNGPFILLFGISILQAFSGMSLGKAT